MPCISVAHKCAEPHGPNSQPAAAVAAARSWLGVRLDAVCATVLLAGALLAVAMRRTVQPELLALALTQTLQLVGVTQWLVRQVRGGVGGMGGGGGRREH